jgi:hypothetical protein
LPPRPKGMHRHTYERLCRRYAMVAARCGAGQFSAVAAVIDGLDRRRSPHVRTRRKPVKKRPAKNARANGRPRDRIGAAGSPAVKS